MTKVAVFFAYTPEVWSKLIARPSDRPAAARAAAESVGGTLDSLHFMFGDWDGFAIFDVSDTERASAVSIAIASSGAFRHFETRQLIDPGDLPGVLQKAAAAQQSYSPPGT